MGVLSTAKKHAKIMGALTEMCDTTGKAPSASALANHLKENHEGMSRAYVQATLLQFANTGKIERKEIGGYSYYRPNNSAAEYPIDYNQIVYDAVISLNRAGKIPTCPVIARTAGCSEDTAHKVLHRIGLKAMGRWVKAVRLTNYLYGYVAVLPEFRELIHEHETPTITPDPEQKPYRIRGIGTAIGRREIADARARTKPGDVFPVLRKLQTEPAVISRGIVTVKYVMPYICVFTNGESVRWADIALYYRNKKTIELSGEVWRCAI